MPATIDATAGAAFVPAGSKGERLRSANLADHPVPDGREEDWRFTPIARMRPLLDGADATATSPSAGPPPEPTCPGWTPARRSWAGSRAR